MSERRGDSGMNLRSATISRRSILLGALGVTATAALGPAASAVGAASGISNAPTAASHIALLIDGTVIATFSELTGISAEVEPIEYWQSSDNGPAPKKLPGITKPPSVTLKRGMSGGRTLWAWHKQVLDGNAGARKNCSLVINSADGKPVARYDLENAWPSKLEISGLKAGSSEVLTETMKLVCERIQRVAV